MGVLDLLVLAAQVQFPVEVEAVLVDITQTSQVELGDVVK
jgi:hypothetical protein